MKYYIIFFLSINYIYFLNMIKNTYWRTEYTLIKFIVLFMSTIYLRIFSWSGVVVILDFTLLTTREYSI